MEQKYNSVHTFNTEIDERIVSWIENNTIYALYKHESNCENVYEYYVYEQDFEYNTVNKRIIRTIISERIERKTADEVIVILSKPTIVKVSGYKGDIPESPVTITVDSINAEIQVCNNAIIHKTGIKRLVHEIKCVIMQIIKPDVNQNMSTIQIEYGGCISCK